MGLTGLRLRSLVYHSRGNLAVLLGVVVGTAVLTGALLVRRLAGRQLRDLTLRRLGWVDQALIGPKFFRVAVADGLPADRAAPAILLQATAQRNGVLYGVSLCWASIIISASTRLHRVSCTPTRTRSLLSPNLMDDLGVAVGDEVVFRVQRRRRCRGKVCLVSDPIPSRRFICVWPGAWVTTRGSLQPESVAGNAA